MASYCVVRVLHVLAEDVRVDTDDPIEAYRLVRRSVVDGIDDDDRVHRTYPEEWESVQHPDNGRIFPSTPTRTA